MWMFHPSSFEMGVANYTHIVGIDPGSENLGVSVFRIDPNTGLVLGSQAATYRGSKIITNPHVMNVHGARYGRIHAHYQNLLPVLLQYQPIAIACESPFFQMGRPQAFGALTEVVSMIRDVLQEYHPNLSLYLIDPPSVKNAVGAKGNAGKDDVRAAILNIAHLLNYEGPGMLGMLDEHSLDSLAVGYGYIRSIFSE